VLKIIQAVLSVMLLTSASITNGQECWDPGWLCGRNFVMHIQNDLDIVPRKVIVKCFFPGRGYLKKTGIINYELPVKIMFHPTLKKIPNPLLVKMQIIKEDEENVAPHRPLYSGTIHYGEFFTPLQTYAYKPSLHFVFGIENGKSTETCQTLGFKMQRTQKFIWKEEVFD
jgi:hypothetical protein